MSEALRALIEAPPPPEHTHELKTWPHFFQAVLDGRKPFELRRNDRNFRVGDWLLLREYLPHSGTYTGRSVRALITFIAQDSFGLPSELCVLGLRVESSRDAVLCNVARAALELEDALMLTNAAGQASPLAQLPIIETLRVALDRFRSACEVQP